MTKQAVTCDCPSDGKDKGVISTESKNHLPNCRFRIKLRRMAYEDIRIVGIADIGRSSMLSYTSLNSAREVL